MTKQFKINIRIRYADKQRTLSGTLKGKSYEQVIRCSAEQVELWSSDDSRMHGPAASVSISIRELKPKPAKRKPKTV